MMLATLAYVPVVHKGTLDFYRAYPGDIYLLDNVAAGADYVYFERDMRALSAGDIKKELEVLDFAHVRVIAPLELPTLKDLEVELIAPQDEAVQFFVEKYAPDLKITYVQAFLRWNKLISSQELVVPPHRTLTGDDFAREVMVLIHDTAARSSDWWRQVAAAVVKDGEVLFSDHNRHLPSAHAPYINGDPRSNLDAGQQPNVYTSIHAEAALVARAARDGIALRGADIYVTTFPCAVCARLIREAGIARLFYDKGYSTLDAEEILTQAGVEILKVEMDQSRSV